VSNPAIPKHKCNYNIAHVNKCPNIRAPSLADAVVDAVVDVEAQNTEVGVVEVVVVGVADTMHSSRNDPRRRTFSI
jgi:hypothetical protein